LCDDKRCFAERDGAVIYRDSHHLTDAGSRMLAPMFQQSAAWRSLWGKGLTTPRQAAN
jgi:hypothetical protein